MDHLLHETDGGRRMANQIVRQVFREPSSKQEKLITGAKVRFPHLFRFLINKHTKNISFSYDVTAAILVSQNNETAAMLVYQTNPAGIQLFSYFNTNKFVCVPAT